LRKKEKQREVQTQCSGVITTTREIPCGDRNLTVVERRRLGSLPEDHPTLVYLHGGGWVRGSAWLFLGCRLAQELDVEVVSIEYSLSPEAPPGLALNETNCVWEAIKDRKRRIIAGCSSGGNIVASFAALTKDKPYAAILVYPVIDISGRYYESYDTNNKYGLSLDRMDSYTYAYVPDEEERKSPLYSVINANLSDYPPTLVITAQFDILRDEGREFAVRLHELGRPVCYRCVRGTRHGFVLGNGSYPGYISFDEMRHFLKKIER
jgi:acetyl esterase